MPMISVIVPVYKVEKYIHRCVDSILAQTYTNFELILVDDGSPDNCGIICDEYAKKDKRIVVIHQENGGLSAARNAGVLKALGDYFLFVDSDDVIHPECLKILVNCVHDTNADIVQGQIMRFEEGMIPKTYFSLWDGAYTTKTGKQTLHNFFESVENLPSMVSACGKLWHKSLFHGIQFPVGRLFEDEFTTYKLYAQAKKVVFVNISLYFYFINHAGITQNLTLEKRLDEYDAQWERIQFFKNTNQSDFLGKACMNFLNTAQWDLIECRKKHMIISNSQSERFNKQYLDTFQLAQKMNLLSFLEYYDYYILAQPKYSLFYRLKRQILLFFERCKS